MKPHPALAHPSHPPRRNSHHQSKGWHIAPDNCAGSYKAVLPQGYTTQDGGISSDGRPAPDPGCLVFGLPRNMASRVHHVGKDAAGAAEHVVFELNTLINGHVVLHLDV